jgi:peptide/nickel transport system substrate-binding protein
MRAKHRCSIALVAGLVALAQLSACAQEADESAFDTSTLILAEMQQYVGNWDPTQGGVGGFYHEWQAVFDPLTIWDGETRSFEPWLAEEITMSDDRKTMTFRLRDDVKFSDGERLDAAGVQRYYESVVKSEQYAYGGLIVGYDPKFTATDEYVLELTTSKPIYAPDFRMLLTSATPVLSPSAVDNPERALSEPLGSGPYLLGETVDGVEATFTRNPDYWNPEAFPFDQIVLKTFDDPVAMLNALKSGQIDATVLELGQVADAEASGFALHEGGSGYSAIFVRDPENSTIAALRDVRVRQAIAMAFDREAIAEKLLLGHGTVSSQAFIPAQAEYIEGKDNRYPYDIDQARSLLTEAGYSDGFDVVVPAYSGTASLEPIVESALNAIGIRVTYEDFPDYLGWFTAMTSGDYPLILQPSLVNSSTMRYLVEEFPGYGRAMAPNEEIAELVSTIKEGSSEESAEASQALGTKVLEEALLIPIGRGKAFYGSQTGLEMDVSRSEGFVLLKDIRPAS